MTAELGFHRLSRLLVGEVTLSRITDFNMCLPEYGHASADCYSDVYYLQLPQPSEAQSNLAFYISLCLSKPHHHFFPIFPHAAEHVQPL